MNGEKALHPFFSKSHEPNVTLQDENHENAGQNPSDTSDEPAKTTTLNGKRKSPKLVQPSIHGKTQRTLQETVKSKTEWPQQGGCSGQEPELPPLSSAVAEEETSPRKRQRSSEYEYAELGAEVLEHTPPSNRRRQSSPQVAIPVSSPLPVASATAPGDITPPKKMLRLNASGKFSSPISKPKSEESQSEIPKKRGRPRKAKLKQEKASLMVTIHYGAREELGPMVARILAGEEVFIRATDSKSTPEKQRAPSKRPPKPTHPFFTGNATQQAPPSRPPGLDSPRKASAVTPGKLRRHTLSADRLQLPSGGFDAWSSSLGKDRFMIKHPGAKEAAWPVQGQTHVRGLDLEEVKGVRQRSPTCLPHTRKKKAANKPIPPEESVIRHFASSLAPERDGRLRDDGFQEPHPSLHVPKKLLISGEEIRARVSKELSVTLEDPDASQSAHPMLRNRYETLSKTLTAFDNSRGEVLDWTSKYAPNTAAEVLQSGREVTVLKDWLTSLTITAVENVSKLEPKPSGKPDSKPKKKRRRKDDLDDFLVDSDEEINDMTTVNEAEDTKLLPDGRRVEASLVRTNLDGVKLSNTVVLSGPYGCGKTAAVYAVAKELGFKVFEINPSERRSGKDVLERVGDMTENHLVKHHGTEIDESSWTEDPTRMEEAFQNDLASGRQGKMSSFFKPAANTKLLSPRKKKTAVPKKALEALQKALKKPAKDQQQSLILLEEVDILFRDDKEFWAIVLSLMRTSKRPFIMTCNDESLLPVKAMSPHAILRFSAPSPHLAIDYLLLLAAAEGHLIKHRPAASLYAAKGNDLRSSIAELEFWCQMGVGDPRSGLGWIFQRYPPGSDVDEQGRKLRVVSEDTYQSGIGLSPKPDLNDEAQLLWAWQEYGSQPTRLLGWKDLQHDQCTTLRSFAAFADSLSAVDVYTRAASTLPLDTTQPPLTDKARGHYVEGRQLLQCDETSSYRANTHELAVSSIIFAFHAVRRCKPDEVNAAITARILSDKDHRDEEASYLTRHDFTCFDAIAGSSEPSSSASSVFQQSVFDGTMNSIATDLAPYVRSIIQYDLVLEKRRDYLSSVTGEGRSSKRARTTRAARSALEGSQRASTRRERWFSKELDLDAVLATGGKEWPHTAIVDPGEMESRDSTATPASSAE